MPQPTMLTDWYCIMQSGKTIDGRNIDPQWVQDMADTYDRDLYTANINYEHMTLGTYGMVHEVEARKDGADLKLFARLEPNENTIALNKANRGKFFSAELLPNFRGTGKVYLKALALTDDPASVGTSQLKFSCEVNGTFVAEAVQIPDSFATDLLKLAVVPEKNEAAITNFFSSLTALLNFNKSKPQQETDAMQDKQFEELKGMFTALSARIETIEKAKPAEATTTATTTEKPNEFAALTEKIETLMTGQKALEDKVNEFSKIVPPTTVPGTTGAEDDNKPLY